jgi:glutathione S-transferase
MTSTHTPSTQQGPIHLYSADLCPYAMRVRHTLAEKGLAFELTEIDPRNKPDWFAQVSPHGKIPLLVDGEERIWESAAICEYLEDAFAVAALLPNAPAQRARARAWIAFADDKLYGATNTMFHSRDPDLMARTIRQFPNDIRVLEEQAFAHGGPWVLGAAFSLADIALYPWFDQACVLEAFCGLKMPSAPRLDAWRRAMLSRPALHGIAKSPDAWIRAYGKLLNAA